MTASRAASTPRSSAWFDASVTDFLALPFDTVLGRLAGASTFDVTVSQRDAWRAQLAVLATSLRGLDGRLYLEFGVPRLGSRIDAVLVTGPAVFPIEFKVGQRFNLQMDRNQAWDYGLDLKNFHRASRDASIWPVLVATEAESGDAAWVHPHADGVSPPRLCNAAGLATCLRAALADSRGPVIDAKEWGRSPYHPTPTIVEAARALFANHSVESISRNDAGARNLAVTSARVESAIDDARRSGHKAIVLVTGVPGAGKTLVGLNIATRRSGEVGESHAVFLSGNAPLVAVLREALIRDEVQRACANGQKVRKGDIAQRVKPFIQNVHHFRDEALRDESRPPHDRIAIFDEAQRAWNLEQTSSFMRQKKGRPGFAQSEPQFLIGSMDRHSSWAAVVCLVGGGQEINTGEAGIRAWLDAIHNHFPHWRVHVSPHLTDSEYAVADAVTSLAAVADVRTDPDLHLATSMRSFRAERLSAFVRAALDGDIAVARDHLARVLPTYPILMTRDLERAREWLRSRARGTERCGLVASSRGLRLKPDAIDMRVEVNPIHWFLNDPSDTRSSAFLEDAASEFKVQGLELDWVGVAWDADLRRTGQAWGHHAFRGDGWVRIKAEMRRKYLLNAYRVLLTRARQGMVIYVPEGATQDPTRAPALYDGTAEYLCSLGVPSLD
jgi:hypothetical protein